MLPFLFFLTVLVFSHGYRVIADYRRIVVKADQAYTHGSPPVGADFSDAETDNLVGGGKQDKAVFIGDGDRTNDIACLGAYLEIDDTDTASVLLAV